MWVSGGSLAKWIARRSFTLKYLDQAPTDYHQVFMSDSLTFGKNVSHTSSVFRILNLLFHINQKNILISLLLKIAKMNFFLIHYFKNVSLALFGNRLFRIYFSTLSPFFPSNLAIVQTSRIKSPSPRKLLPFSHFLRLSLIKMAKNVEITRFFFNF